MLSWRQVVATRETSRLAQFNRYVSRLDIWQMLVELNQTLRAFNDVCDFVCWLQLNLRVVIHWYV